MPSVVRHEPTQPSDDATAPKARRAAKEPEQEPEQAAAEKKSTRAKKDDGES